MPIIGSHEVDSAAFHLLWDWIIDLGKRTPPIPEKHPLGPNAKLAEALPARGDSQVLANVSSALWVLYRPTFILRAGPDLELEAGMASTDPNIAPLFERFLPPERRRKTIGLTPDVPQLLSLTGDAKRGSAMLTPTGSLGTCLACHFVNGTGRDFGPDLSKVGSRPTKEQLLESLLDPSKQIAPGYAAYMAELSDGMTQMGFAVKQTKEETVLKLATGQSITLRAQDVKSLKALPGSLMSVGLLQSLTAQEVADLLVYLQSLK